MNHEISTVLEYNLLYVYLCSHCSAVSSYKTNMCNKCTYDSKKGKVHPITCHDGTEREWRYSSTLSLTPVLDEDGELKPCPG
jgi:ribosomal protein L40E